MKTDIWRLVDIEANRIADEMRSEGYSRFDCANARFGLKDDYDFVLWVMQKYNYKRDRVEE